jgi:hypothetical protein
MEMGSHDSPYRHTVRIKLRRRVGRKTTKLSVCIGGSDYRNERRGREMQNKKRALPCDANTTQPYLV